MSKKASFKKGLVVLIVILVVILGSVIGTFFASAKKDGGFKRGGNYLAVLHVEGTIQKAGDTYNQEWILSNISKFKNDSRNKGILLFIDSPGGTVYEADETYLALQDYKSTGKKVFAYQGSMAASGGYYISCAADQIYANRNTLTGSIGVIAGSFLDITEFLEDHGISYETVHAGKNKNMGNYNEPVTDEQYEIMQKVADECYDQFTSIVSTSRHIPYSQVLPLCDGRIYTASQALVNGLIDGISSWDDFVETVKNSNPEFENCKLKTFRYERQKGFFELAISSMAEKQRAETLEGIPSALWNQMNLKGPLYMYR